MKTVLMPTDIEINNFLQNELLRQGLNRVDAIAAAQWLHKANLLKDLETKPGLPLRKLLRKNLIRGGVQEPTNPHGRWYIGRIDQNQSYGTPQQTCFRIIYGKV